MKFTDADKLKAAFASLGGEPGAPPAVVMAAPPVAAVPPAPAPMMTRAGRVTTDG
jgi:hypothetical protein